MLILFGLLATPASSHVPGAPKWLTPTARISYTGERPAAAKLLDRIRADALSYWRANGGLGPCDDNGGQLIFADSLLDDDDMDGTLGSAGDVNPSGRGEVAGCRAWLRADVIGALEVAGARGDGHALLYEWYLVAHELGHAIGHSHTATGLMCGPPAIPDYCPFEQTVTGEAFVFAAGVIGEQRCSRARQIEGRRGRRLARRFCK